MKRFSRNRFSEIMINNVLKKELYDLKQPVKKEAAMTWKRISYGDVISYLVKEFKKSRDIEEQPLDKKLRVGYKFSSRKLRVSRKLNQKRYISYSLDG